MNWHELNKALPDMSEDEVKYLMQLERRRVEPRVTFLVRLHQLSVLKLREQLFALPRIAQRTEALV